MKNMTPILDSEVISYSADIDAYLNQFLEEMVHANHDCAKEITKQIHINTHTSKNFNQEKLMHQIELVLGYSLLDKYQNPMVNCQNHLRDLANQLQNKIISAEEAYQSMLAHTNGLQQNLFQTALETEETNAKNNSSNPISMQEKEKHVLDRTIVLYLATEWGIENVKLYENEIREVVDTCYKKYTNRLDTEDVKVLQSQLTERTNQHKISVQSDSKQVPADVQGLPHNVIY